MNVRCLIMAALLFLSTRIRFTVPWSRVVHFFLLPGRPTPGKPELTGYWLSYEIMETEALLLDCWAVLGVER